MLEEPKKSFLHSLLPYLVAIISPLFKPPNPSGPENASGSTNSLRGPSSFHSG